MAIINQENVKGDFDCNVKFVPISKDIKDFVESGDIDYVVIEDLDFLTMTTYIRGTSMKTKKSYYFAIEGWNLSDDIIKESMEKISEEINGAG